MKEGFELREKSDCEYLEASWRIYYDGSTGTMWKERGVKLSVKVVSGIGYVLTFENVSDDLVGICSVEDKPTKIVYIPSTNESQSVHQERGHFCTYPYQLTITLFPVNSISKLTNGHIDFGTNSESTCASVFKQLRTRYQNILEEMEHMNLPNIPKVQTLQVLQDECGNMRINVENGLSLLKETREVKSLLELHDKCMELIERWMPWSQIYELTAGDHELLKEFVEQVRCGSWQIIKDGAGDR